MSHNEQEGSHGARQTTSGMTTLSRCELAILSLGLKGRPLDFRVRADRLGAGYSLFGHQWILVAQ